MRKKTRRLANTRKETKKEGRKQQEAKGLISQEAGPRHQDKNRDAQRPSPAQAQADTELGCAEQ